MSYNENAWAFTYLPCFPSCTDLLPKSPFFVMDWETYTNSLCDIMWHHDVIPWPRLTSRRHTVMPHEITPYAIWFHMSISLGQKPGNHIFWPCDLDLWPMTLTYNLRLVKVKVNSHTKNQGHRSKGSAVRVLTGRQTHTQTERWLRFNDFDLELN